MGGERRACSARVDHSRSNRERSEIERKMAMLDEARVRPLSGFVRRLRVEQPEQWIPWFDPTDAGVEARILRLSEAPGGMAVTQRGGSGFVSADNDDPSANSWTFLREAGVDRCHEIVTWNAVPWYLGSETKVAAATARDLEAARASLFELIALLGELRVVVLMGRKAQRLWRDVLAADPSLGRLAAVAAPHQSPLSVNRWPGVRGEIVEALAGGAAGGGRRVVSSRGQSSTAPCRVIRIGSQNPNRLGGD